MTESDITRAALADLDALIAQRKAPKPKQPPQKRWPPTDAGNALCLARLYGHVLRFVHGPDLWRLWSGRHWADDAANRADVFALDVAGHRLREAAAMTGPAADQHLRWALASTSVSRRRATLVAASTMLPFTTSLEDYDRDPLLLNCGNGLLDLRSAHLRPHDSAALLSKLAPVDYLPDAPCPRWEQFLAQVFLGDSDLIAFSRRLLGYLLTGDTREQAAFFLVGKGANGKTVFVETLRSLLGGYAANAPAAAFLGSGDSPTELLSFLGARLVTASEGAASQVLNEALFKRLTGGDLLTSRRPRHQPFSYSPSFKLLFATNEMPRLPSQSYALQRRAFVLPFRQTFYGPADGKTPLRDETLRDSLARELPGILAWAVSGCLEWQQHGLQPPPAVMQETDAVLDAQDPLAAFLSACCTQDPQAQVETGRLWQAYLSWCAAQSQPPACKSPTWFIRNLTQRHGLDLLRRHSGRFVVGLGLLPQSSGDKQ